MWRFLLVLQFYCLLAVYIYLGLTPNPEAVVGDFNDLVMHFTGYFIAAFSISAARPNWTWWQKAVFLVSFSIAIEIGQHFNPPRTFSLLDITANSLGVISGLLAVKFLSVQSSLMRKLLG